MRTRSSASKGKAEAVIEGGVSKRMSAVKGDLKTYRAAVRSREVAQKRALIGHVFQRPAIWNRSVEEHKSRCYVDSMWDEVATQTGWDREFCKKTWKHLVDHFRNIYCHTMFRKNVSDGKEPNPPPPPPPLSVKWTYFKNMLFMKDCVQKRLAFPNTSASDGEVFINADTSAIEPQCSWPDAQNVAEFVVEDVRDIGEGDMAHGVVEMNDVAMSSRTPAAPISSLSSPSNKRRRMDVLAHAVDSCTDNNSAGFHNQSSKTSAVGMQNQVKTEDTEDKFCQFLGDILREVSPKLRRACRSMLLEVCNSFADGKIPSLIQPDQNPNEI